MSTAVVHINSEINLICLCMNFVTHEKIRFLSFAIMFQFEDDNLPEFTTSIKYAKNTYIELNSAKTSYSSY